MAGFCENGVEPLGTTNGGDFWTSRGASVLRMLCKDSPTPYPPFYELHIQCYCEVIRGYHIREWGKGHYLWE
jgi:hypothetical protein